MRQRAAEAEAGALTSAEMEEHERQNINDDHAVDRAASRRRSLMMGGADNPDTPTSATAGGGCVVAPFAAWVCGHVFVLPWTAGRLQCKRVPKQLMTWMKLSTAHLGCWVQQGHCWGR
jgi:hypothetical protein